MKTKRIAVVCANIGSFDPVFKFPDQTIDCDFHYFTEKNLPYPLPNLNNRLRSKYIKIQMHRFLPDYDEYIWIDGSVEVLGKRFAQHMHNHLEGHEVAMSVHHERNTVYEELEYILTNMEAGKEYLIKRYRDEPLAEEMAFYKNSHLSDDHSLYITRFFARRNNKVTNAAFDDWWNRCLEFVNFDQAMFSYIAWRHGVVINELDYLHTVGNFLKVHKH